LLEPGLLRLLKPGVETGLLGLLETLLRSSTWKTSWLLGNEPSTDSAWAETTLLTITPLRHL
jgi:hypothetical protein